MQPCRRSRAAAGQVQFAALRVVLKRVDDGVGQPFEHRPLQLRAGGVLANAEITGPRLGTKERRAFAVEVGLPEDAAAARFDAGDILFQLP